LIFLDALDRLVFCALLKKLKAKITQCALAKNSRIFSQKTQSYEAHPKLGGLEVKP